jgi:four helix bundle protein
MIRIKIVNWGESSFILRLSDLFGKMMRMKPAFDHEKLNVYQEAIRFVGWTDEILHDIPKSLAAYNQLDRASTSIPLNIAEGNGKYTASDRCRFFDIARGSALECAAALDVLVVKQRITAEVCLQGKEILIKIVSMLVGLIRGTSPDRVHEDREDYGTDPPSLPPS